MRTKKPSATKAQVKKAVHQHETKMHKGEPKTKIRLGRKGARREQRD